MENQTRISNWGDIFEHFNQISKIRVSNTTLSVTGIVKGEETVLQTTYGHKKVAQAVAKKLRQVTGL